MNNTYEIYRPFVSECVWNIKDVLKVLLFYFFMIFVGAPVLFKIVNYISGNDLVNSFGENSILIIFSLVVNILCGTYIIYVICVEHKLPLISLGLTFINWRKNVAEGLKNYLIAIPLLALAGVLTNYICQITGTSPQQQEITKKVIEEDSTFVLVFMVVFGSLAAPIVEELLFRGFLQTALYRYLGRWKSIFVSSFFFAIVHLNIYVFLQIFLLGILLSYVFDKTKSLVSTIAIHSVHNTATFALLLYFRKVL